MPESAHPDTEKKSGFFGRLKERLQRTRSGFVEGIASLVLGRKKIDAELLDEIEALLLTADVGVDATRQIIKDLEARISRSELADSEALFAALRADLLALLAPRALPLRIEGASPFVILMVGVNGAGKTTTIGKPAGRLHTQTNLMAELQKVKRVMAKVDPTAPHETLLVLDGGTGQNAVNQAVQFDGAVGVTGIALTKLDGTAKGGVIFAVAKRLDVPIRFVGVGEGIEDLRVFDAAEFVDALFARQ